MVRVFGRSVRLCPIGPRSAFAGVHIGTGFVHVTITLHGITWLLSWILYNQSKKIIVNSFEAEYNLSSKPVVIRTIYDGIWQHTVYSECIHYPYTLAARGSGIYLIDPSEYVGGEGAWQTLECDL